MRSFIQITDGVPVAWGLAPYAVRSLAPSNISLPVHLDQFEYVDLSAIGFETFIFITPPNYDHITQGLREATPVLLEGIWTQQWETFPLDIASITANQQQAEASRIAALWQAAHDYEFAQVSGSAIGLLAMGVMQGLPKCIAVQNWIKTIWTVYYTRKAIGEVDTDFSLCGMCPHPVPELMVELGV